jgi:putative transposase
MRVLAFCLMPNHWHLLLWPQHDGDLAAFMQVLTTTHVRRWRAHRASEGKGYLYQGSYKSFPVQSDDHFYTVCRYVERNPLRANLVGRAEAWRWSSLWSRRQSSLPQDYPPLADWPLPTPADWMALVNQPQTSRELAAIRLSIHRGRPFGERGWRESTAKSLGLASTLHG